MFSLSSKAVITLASYFSFGRGTHVDKDQVEGKLKETEGKLTDDEGREAEGKAQGAWGGAKESAGDAKDAAEKKWDDVKD
jgi:uncharacterized protein YjbJ (UPF0337 family)